MSAPLPPVPDLIPISALRKGSNNNNNNNSALGCSGIVNNNNNNVVDDGGGVKVRECTSTQCTGEVMGEQRSRRTGEAAAAVAEQIDTPRSRGSGEGAAPQPAATSRKARAERHRKSDRRRDRERERRKRSVSSANKTSCASSPPPVSPERPANPRVNPIFVWVRQEDTQIVEVKCEDYDKRNRILLTKTAQGWRAIPRTETLAPALHRSDDVPKHKKSKRHRVKKRSMAVQVCEVIDVSNDTEDQDEEDETVLQQQQEQAAANVNTVDETEASAHVESPTSPPAGCHNKCEASSPLDNLLAVAELEFNQHLQAEQWENDKQDPVEEVPDEINNMEQLDMFIESCAPDDDQKSPKADECECDYTEEDDNNIAMDDILSRLEQSLRSPDTLHAEIAEMIKAAPQRPKIEQESATDLTITKQKCADDLMPTDLSVPKCHPSPLKRPQSQNSETIQSPQPSGIPAVPQSPDIYNKTKSNIYLESLLSPPLKEKEKEPLDLGKSRESDSPKVTCSQENEAPPAKKIKLEDITLKNLLDREAVKKPTSKPEDKAETPRLLELLKHEADPVTQLKQVLATTSLNVPDPMLIPKDRLSQVLSHPAREIPKLLTQRPELRLPEALAFPHLLQDPNILVITLAQLETIVHKQSQTIPLVEQPTSKEEASSKKEEGSSKKEEPAKAANITSTSIMSPPKERPKKPQPPTPPATTTAKISELSTDIDAATNAAFTQMMWLPYLNQLETAMSIPSGAPNPEFLKMLSTMLPGYPTSPMPDMSHMMGANRPFAPPPPTAYPPPMNYNPLEMSMWQEAMMQARSKAQFENIFGKDRAFPKNPYLQFQPPPPPARPIIPPQYGGYAATQKPPKPSRTSGSHATYAKHQQKMYENEKMMRHKEAVMKQQEMYKQQQLQQQQEMLAAAAAAAKPKVACKPFANIAAHEHQVQMQRRYGGRVPVPIDLSGPPPPVPLQLQHHPTQGKLKVKQHLVDPARLLKQDEVSEVGSTTASIEEMQDAHKHLWHPLFGNQKSYTSQWNWTTVTATGE